jgi:alpha-D-xyloside xylohydrolase
MMNCNRSFVPFLSVFLVSSFVLQNTFAQSAEAVPVQKVVRQNDGVLFQMTPGLMKLQVWGDGIVRVLYTSGTRFSNRKSLVVVKPAPDPVRWKFRDEKDDFILETKKLGVRVKKRTGAVTFSDKRGGALMKEPETGGKILTPAKVLGEDCFHAEQQFDFTTDEGIYGFGGHQDGVMNYNGKNVLLVQENTVDVTPVFVSTKGYGILWDNCSLTEFRDESSPGSLWSEVADQIDYYFLYGPELDQVIAGYRDLTGPAPMFGKWAYGFWQSKERYNTQQELLDVVMEYRERSIPLDVIVQDWFYWNPKPWGSHYFDRLRYPDPAGMIQQLHDRYHVKIMISVWAKFDPGSANHAELSRQGFLYPSPPTGSQFSDGTQYYDAFNPEARKTYWKQMRDSLFVKSIDAWWLDATEPEIGDLSKDGIKGIMNNYLGKGSRTLNAYSLMTTEAVYKGQRAETSDKRVCILTRSVFAGQQRNAAATWSGDIQATWDVFRTQIACGLNFCLSGVPYWTTDIGAFFASAYIGGCRNEEYRELFTRWFQFGAFCPVMRVHGTSTPREIWRFGEPGTWAYETLVKFDRLRYRLLPYIYSLAWKTTSEGYTPMRGLSFDFREDPDVRSIADQFMFGPAFLVNPVTRLMYHHDPTRGNIGKVIPAGRFFSNDGKAPGLKADYFNGADFQTPVLTRMDSTIHFDWGNQSPSMKVHADSFSVRWTGKLLTAKAGKYRFTSYADDGVRLWIGGKPLIVDWRQHAPEYNQAEIDLPADALVDFQFEYYEAIGGAVVRLQWAEPEPPEPQAAKKADPNVVQTRNVYLPGQVGWTDFWTGRKMAGGQTIRAAAPIDILPLYVKAGSIVPMGTAVQYATERPADPIELRIYPGAEGEFVLYEDENDNYNYEKGLYSTIPIQWNDADKTLVIGDRKGSFPGFLRERTFDVVLVREGHGVGMDPISRPDQAIRYTGKKILIQL